MEIASADLENESNANQWNQPVAEITDGQSCTTEPSANDSSDPNLSEEAVCFGFNEEDAGAANFTLMKFIPKN